MFLMFSVFATGCQPGGMFSGPITYTLKYEVGEVLNGEDPFGLAGATVTYVVHVDTSNATPTRDASKEDNPIPHMTVERQTMWPATNVTATVTIEGSESGDGTYAGTIPRGASISVTNDMEMKSRGNRDMIVLPGVEFKIGDQNMYIASPDIMLKDSVITNSGTVRPVVFAPTDVSKYSTSIIYRDLGSSPKLEGISIEAATGGAK